MSEEKLIAGQRIDTGEFVALNADGEVVPAFPKKAPERIADLLRFTWDDVRKMAVVVAREEREACARLIADGWEMIEVHDMVKAILARGDNP